MKLNEHEEAFIRSFVAPDKRERWASLMSTAKGRRKFRNRLCHNFDTELDQRYTYQEGHLPDEVSRSVKALLRDAGWKKTDLCYVMAESDLDGQEMAFEELEEDRKAGTAMIVCVIPQRLAYYWTEDRDPDYVLFRPELPNYR